MKNYFNTYLKLYCNFILRDRIYLSIENKNIIHTMFSSLRFFIRCMIMLFFLNLSALPMDLEENDDIQLTISPTTKLKDKEDDKGTSRISLLENDELLTESSHLSQNSKEKLVPFLEWVEQQILEDPKETQCSKFLGVTGLGIGLIAAYASFPLAGDFGILVAKALGSQNAKLEKAIYVLCGINAAIPSMALNSVATRSQFKRLAEKSNRDDELSGNYKKIKALKFLAHGLGLFSAVSSGYVGYLVSKDFPLPFQILFTACAYGGCYMFTVESQKRISTLLVNRSTHSKASNLKRENLRERLVKAMKSISSMDKEKFNTAYNELFNNLEVENLEEKHVSTLNKIKNLLNLGKEELELKPASKGTSFGGKVVTVIGALIGTAETYVAFSLVNDATPFLCDAVGINNPVAKNVISKTFASLACIPWGSLDIEGVCGSFSRIYRSFFYKDHQYAKEFVKPTVKKTITGFSVWGGISAAIPPTYLAIQATKGLPLALRIIISGATFLCPATVLEQALEEMLDQGWTWIKSFKSDSIEKHREKLVKAIEKIYFKINELPDGTIDSMYKHLK